MVLNPVISKLTGKLVVLASASPRRVEILRNAKHKKTPDIVIGADTIVTVDGMILEKPKDKNDAYRMLSSLSGKEHSVFTGVAIMLCHEEEHEEVDYQLIDFYEETKVKFADLSEDLLWEYINSGEPMDKAGGYGIQALGGMLVEYVHGDFLNVVGFPLNHFCKQLDLIYNQSTSSSVQKDECDLNQHNGTEEGECEPTKEEIERIMELLDGFKASKALFTASKLGLFDLLHSTPGLAAAQVAQQIKASVKGTECLLEACASLGLLKACQRAVYENTELAERLLRSDASFSLLGYIEHCNDTIWPLFSHLESAVLEGTPQHGKAFSKKNKDLSQKTCSNSREVKRRFMNAMDSIAKVTGKTIATAFDLSAYKTACDLGGCTGAMAHEFTKAHPGLAVTVFDLPAVIEMRDYFHPVHTDDRVSFVAGDFFQDELPKADLYILARILHDWPNEKVCVLLRKIADACTPGCGLLLSEIFLEEDRHGPSRGLLQALSMSEGKQRSVSEYSRLLESFGFSTAHVTHTHNFLDAMLCIKV
uniref:Acetylserotonin O-methyltransferase-like n=1 Tax=Gouania willdenowi TaxID=441366 RepID=A0A8C5E7K4_GOUWI